MFARLLLSCALEIQGEGQQYGLAPHRTDED
jgi:hypothetical protein